MWLPQFLLLKLSLWPWPLTQGPLHKSSHLCNEENYSRTLLGLELGQRLRGWGGGKGVEERRKRKTLGGGRRQGKPRFYCGSLASQVFGRYHGYWYPDHITCSSSPGVAGPLGPASGPNGIVSDLGMVQSIKWGLLIVSLLWSAWSTQWVMLREDPEPEVGVLI